MTELVETVRTKVSDECLEFGKCEKDGCGISLEDAPEPHLVIDFDKPGSPLPKDQTRCDYLFLAAQADNGYWVVPLELKSGKYDASKVVEQLEAGTREAEKIVSSRIKVSFRPILVSGKGARKAEREEFKRKGKVSFRGGKPKPIKVIRCGGKLAEKLRE